MYTSLWSLSLLTLTELLDFRRLQQQWLAIWSEWLWISTRRKWYSGEVRLAKNAIQYLPTCYKNLLQLEHTWVVNTCIQTVSTGSLPLSFWAGHTTHKLVYFLWSQKRGVVKIFMTEKAFCLLALVWNWYVEQARTVKKRSETLQDPTQGIEDGVVYK